MNSAEKFIRNAMQDCLPPNVPLSFTKVISAHFLKIKQKIAIGALEMVDGKQAVVEVKTYGMANAWAYKWLKWDGGNLYWNGQEWIRETGIEQLSMF